MSTSTDISAEQQAREADITARVLASFAACEDERLKAVMESLVTHLHAFMRETRVSEAEWRQAIAFLTQAGEISDANRQEFVLASDVLGASMQMIAINNEAYANATEATVLGPFFVDRAGAAVHADDEGLNALQRREGGHRPDARHRQTARGGCDDPGEPLGTVGRPPSDPGPRCAPRRSRPSGRRRRRRSCPISAAGREGRPPRGARDLLRLGDRWRGGVRFAVSLSVSGLRASPGRPPRRASVHPTERTP